MKQTTTEQLNKIQKEINVLFDEITKIDNRTKAINTTIAKMLEKEAKKI